MFAAICSSPASAGDASGKIANMSISKDIGSVVFIRLETPPTSRAACSTHGSWHFTLSLNTDLDKRIYASLVAAQLTGRVVQIGGTGACGEWHDVESVRAVGT